MDVEVDQAKKITAAQDAGHPAKTTLAVSAVVHSIKNSFCRYMYIAFIPNFS